MKPETDWLQILVDCKNNVKQRIAPQIKNLGQPQLDLGIGAGGDPIKQVDLAAEKAIVDTLKEHEISFTLISEESGLEEFGKTASQCYVTTDPIDGTTNLMQGVPFYATSIAVSSEPTISTVYAALVTDLFHGTTYTALKGRGASRDGREIAPSKSVSLEEAVIGLDLNTYKVEKIAPRLTNLIQKTKHIRHFGANALEMCYVADGTTDAFVDIRGKLRATDIAAACLIVQEAGGRITTPDGKPLDIKLDPKQKAEFVAAGNANIHRIILNLIRPEKETK